MSLNPIPDDPEEALYPILFNNKDISHLGIGATLYFEYMKFAAYLLFLGASIYTIAMTYTNYLYRGELNNYCSQHKNVSTLFCMELAGHETRVASGFTMTNARKHLINFSLLSEAWRVDWIGSFLI